MTNYEITQEKQKNIEKAEQDIRVFMNKLFTFIINEVTENKYNDTVYFCTVKAIYDTVRSEMVAIYGEQVVRSQEGKMIVLDPTM